MEESIKVDDLNLKLIKEGKTSIYQPQTVFYNPAQEFNRDLSVLVLDTFLENELWKRSKKARKLANKKLTILDALSASGLRGIRYANELINSNKLDKIVMNDLSLNAIKVMKHNVKKNGFEDRIEIENYDANYLMYKSKYEDKQFLCIDLDPYGCAGNFLDAIVQSVLDGGLIMVTATDVAILCGNTPETCFAKYGSMSIRRAFCHEFALRILLRAIDSSALKYGRYIVPLLSLSVDFYVRVFVQVFTGANEGKKSANKTSMVYCCSGCNNFELLNLCTHQKNEKSNHPTTSIKFTLPIGPPVERKCKNCGSNYRVAGPIWNSRLHDFDFVEMLKKNLNAETDELGKQRFGTYRRMKGMLYVVSEELPDSPLFYSLNEFRRVLRINTIPATNFRSAILNAGYEVSQSHTNPDSIKTNAPSSLIWDIIMTWYRLHEGNQTNGNDDKLNNLAEQNDKDNEIKDNELKDKKEDKKNRNKKSSENQLILNRKIETEISFEYNKKELCLSKKLNLVRFQMNPTKNWGPLSLPKLNESEVKIDKRQLNQGRRKRKLEETLDEQDNLKS